MAVEQRGFWFDLALRLPRPARQVVSTILARCIPVACLKRFPAEIREAVLVKRFAAGEDIPTLFSPALPQLFLDDTATLSAKKKFLNPSNAYTGFLYESDTEMAGEFVYLKGEGCDFTNRKVAVVAVWDRDNIIDPYVDYYIRHLAELGYAVVLACETPLAIPESSSHISAAVMRTCAGYDSTSWKAVFAAYPSLFSAIEVLLTNDSVFAPVRPLQPIHEAMDKVSCDFWGLTGSEELIPHLQSFYLVFRSSALQHDSFRQLWKKVKKSNDREKAVNLEISLTLWLASHGLKPAVYIPEACLPFATYNPVIYLWRQLIQYYNLPIFKRNLLSGVVTRVATKGWDDLLAKAGYPVSLVTNFFSRTPRGR